MHVVFRESHGLEETDTPFDLGQTPADLVVLSFSDSDLGAFAAGYRRANGKGDAAGGLPSLRLANLIALRHPLSIDTYVENTLSGARGILIRVIGGAGYWAYGLASVQDLCRRKGIALAVLPADGRPDPALDDLSTLPVSTLRRLSALCDAGGAVAAQAALAQLALAAGLYAGPVSGTKEVPDCGWYDPDHGVSAGGTPIQLRDSRADAPPSPLWGGMGWGDMGTSAPPAVAVTLYRSYVTSADLDPIDALIRALRSAGFHAYGLFVPSLKAPGADRFLQDAFTKITPAAIINATAFSGRGDSGASPLDTPGCPVFQIALSTARKRDWAGSERGLSPADLAMHVALPEVDGRIFAGVASFKSPGKRDPDTQFSQFRHRADATRIAAVVNRVTGWHRLATTPRADRKLALILSTYPGRAHNLAHAVGLDAIASSEGMLRHLHSHGYHADPCNDLARRLSGSVPGACAPPPQASPTGGEGAALLAGHEVHANRNPAAAPPPLVGADGWGGVGPATGYSIATANSDTRNPGERLHASPPQPSPTGGEGDALPAGHEGHPTHNPAGAPPPSVRERAFPENQQSHVIHQINAAPPPSVGDDEWGDVGAATGYSIAVEGSSTRDAGEQVHASSPPHPSPTEGDWAFPKDQQSHVIHQINAAPPPPVGEDGRGANAPTEHYPLTDYQTALATLPTSLQDALHAAWGDPAADPAVRNGAFHFPALRCGNALIALQPERGDLAQRHDSYHDLTRTPRHAYVAFYLWLRAQGIHALIHIGAHGTLEWLPGKSVALSGTCWPEALIRDLPVIYPFIVNDPGEAAQAKRRIGAITLGHLPPPLANSAVPDGLLRLERLLDEYSTADGLDPSRRDRLIAAVREEAAASGVESDLGLAPDATPAEAITRIDRFVCDIKESQFGDGLHIYGMGAGEWDGLMAALDGRRVAAGPAGSPYRGRSDVLPTGRNMYAVDPRAVPSRNAYAQGVKLAEELVRRHLQDQGDYPRSLVVDLWGSATMRTAGEEFAMALHLAGLAPRWDDGSARVSGFDVLPLALLGRPRIDVTLRISGLFRDLFPGLGQMFQAGAEALAQRGESPEDNPYIATSPRVFGPKPGLYGMGMAQALDDYSEAGRMAAGQAWLAAAEWSMDAQGNAAQNRAALEARVRGADGFAHVQDLVETDILLASDYAAHEGGFAAAVASLGGQTPALYHLDATRPDRPQARTLTEEIARVVRARAANPDWATGMMRHGFRGAAEVAATLDHLAAFAHLTRAVPAHLIDLYHDATLGRDDLAAFMERENPQALQAMRDQFRALAEAGLWVTRRNSIAMALRAAE